ncbi:MAG TPA: molybdopterin-synthase adenylyltransferase MoeB [Vicinamibacterales bacterium]|nr:molybdopterin-synthase adenylyltransferase MoeB [Vicinamibacterales bacterium]
MPVRVFIPTPLRPFTAQSAVVEVEGASVAEILRNLTAKHGDLRPHLFADDSRLRSFVNIYVNDEDIRYLSQDQTPVGPGDTVSIVPSVAGGTDSPAATMPERPGLSHDEVRRYSRHLIMPEVGVEGQRRLKAARVLCVGAGGLGSPASLYLAAAGVGTLGLVDFDTVDFSNLQRQILYSTADVGRPKLAAAAARLTALNPHVHVIRHETPLTSVNALEILAGYDVIVDGADNFPTRYLVNDACVLLGKPNAYGSIFRFDGQASVFATAGGPCYRCLYPEPPPPGLVPSCAEGGVLGVLPGIVGTIQATEAIKIILGAGETLAGRLLLFDALSMTFRTLQLRRDPDCPICGDRPTITALIDYDQFCGIATPAPASTPVGVEDEMTVDELKARLDRGDSVWILDVREPREFEICRLAGSTLIPLGELAHRLAEIPDGPNAPDIVVHCKMGARSAKAVALLRDRGYARVRNLQGGILAWIERIDRSLPKY